MTIGQKLQTLRKKRGLSREQLAGKINIEGSIISKWESDEVIPDTENLIKLSKFFHVSIDYLVNNESISSKKNLDVQKEQEEPDREQLFVIQLIMHLLMQGICLVINIAMWMLWQNHISVIIIAVVQILCAGIFELLYQKVKGEEAGRKMRRRYYTVSIWLFAYFPLWRVVTGIMAFYPHPYSGAILQGSVMILYLIICISTDLVLKKK